MSCMGPLNFLTVARGDGSWELHPTGYLVAGTFLVSSPCIVIFGQQFLPCCVLLWGTVGPCSRCVKQEKVLSFHRGFSR